MDRASDYVSRLAYIQKKRNWSHVGSSPTSPTDCFPIYGDWMKYKKIEFAPQISVEQFEDIAVDFFPKILDRPYSSVLITDESSIYDFDFELTEEEVKHDTHPILKKIKDVYKIDVSDIEDLNLCKIFERIRILVLP